MISCLQAHNQTCNRYIQSDEAAHAVVVLALPEVFVARVQTRLDRLEVGMHTLQPCARIQIYNELDR